MPTRDDWIDAGLCALADGGEAALRVDRLAAALGVTKGSFHHHFRGAADLRTSVLAAHREAHSALVAELAASIEGLDAEAVIARLGALIEHVPDAALERAVRAWAAVDPEARAAQTAIDEERLSALEAVWARAVPQPHARTAALIPFLALVGASATTVASAADVRAVLRMLAEEARFVPEIAERL